MSISRMMVAADGHARQQDGEDSRRSRCRGTTSAGGGAKLPRGLVRHIRHNLQVIDNLGLEKAACRYYAPARDATRII